MFESEIFKHRFRWLVQLWLKRRNEKKEKCFSRHELPLNEKEQKNYAFFRVFSLLQPTSFHDTLLVGPFICTPLHHWCFYTPGTISYAYRGTATSISKLLARTINPPPLPLSLSRGIHATENGHDSRGFKKRSARLEFAALVVPFLGFISFRNKAKVWDEWTSRWRF